MEVDHRRNIYLLGLNTLKALMVLLRLHQEWDQFTREQYTETIKTNWMNQHRQQVDAEQCIKLLTRCSKMYEAKA